MKKNLNRLKLIHIYVMPESWNYSEKGIAFPLQITILDREEEEIVSR